MVLASELSPGREATSGSLTVPDVASPRHEPVPSHATVVAAVVTAGVLVLLIALLVNRLAAEIGPDPDASRGPLRALLALGVGLLGGATGLNLGLGG